MNQTENIYYKHGTNYAITAVSYTHLDVYKRQSPDNIQRLLTHRSQVHILIPGY